MSTAFVKDHVTLKKPWVRTAENSALNHSNKYNFTIYSVTLYNKVSFVNIG